MEDIRLILVDDESDFREAIARRLSRRGIVPRQAGTAEDCLARMDESPADVVVADVKMPGMDGIELLSRIKADHPETEVILLTGHACAQDGVAGIKSGAFDYLCKPVEFEHLLGKIRQAHEKKIRAAERAQEARFREKMEQQMILTERLASLGTLATGVAHEINNPLAIIKEAAGWMDLILKKETMADIPRRADLEKAITRIESGVERARRITHQLLSFARQGDSVVSQVRLKELVDESVELLGKEADYRSVELVLELDPDIVVWTDPYPLRQVFVNLLTNGLHATPAGGTLRVAAQKEAETVRIEVSDTGCGIPGENLKRIFEPFFSTKNPGQGTGLGLFVTRGIIDKLGGTIEVESQVGKGTRFIITLPRVRRVPEQSAPKTGSETGDGQEAGLFKRIAKIIR